MAGLQAQQMQMLQAQHPELDQEQLLQLHQGQQQMLTPMMYVFPCCFVCFSLPFWGILIYMWSGVLSLSSMEYVAKSCVVMSSTVDYWQHCSQTDQKQRYQSDCTKIYLPKVSVQVNGDLRVSPSEPTWAYRYHPDNSATDKCSYGHDENSGTLAWTQKFDTGATVPCWQSPDDPEIVKLSEKPFLHEQFWSFNTFLLLMTAFMVLFSGCLCLMIYNMWTNSTPKGARRGMALEEEDEDADEEDSE